MVKIRLARQWLRASARALGTSCWLLALHSAASAASPCDSGPVPPQPVAFEVGCGGKSVCLADDTLQIKPLQADVLPLKITLHFCEGSDSKHSTPLLTLSDNKLARPDPVSVPLGGLLAHMLQADKADAPLIRPLLAAPGPSGKARLAVSIEAANGRGTTDRPIWLDAGTLWTSGALKLAALPPSCGASQAACKLGDALSIPIPNLPAWLSFTKTDSSKLSLLLDGVPLPGLPTLLTHGPQAGVRFELQRKPAPADAADPWADVLKRLRQGSQGITVGVAAGQTEITLPAQPSTVDFAQPGIAPYYLPIFATIVGLFVMGMLDHNLLRDTPPIPELADQMTFSLGRSQMLFWTLVIGSSWLFLYQSTQILWNLNDTALILMGISGATALGAISADEPSDKVKVLVAEHEAARQAAATPPVAATPAAATHRSLADIQADLLKEVGSSGSWLRDISSDRPSQTGLHRVQNMLFTVLLGLAFMTSVVTDFTMANFPASALALLGISGGAYVGFKFKGAAVGGGRT